MKKRNIIFDHLRALSMLGVVAIHVGDLVMQSGTPWNWLYLLCEVLSRYSVPTFFYLRLRTFLFPSLGKALGV